jgi:hypothetical protein
MKNLILSSSDKQIKGFKGKNIDPKKTLEINYDMLF